MKRFLKTGSFCLMLGLAFSCSSDDNSTSGKVTLRVVDKLVITSYEQHYGNNNELISTRLSSISTVVFHYDEKGRVASFNTDQLDEIFMNGGYHNIFQTSLTYNDDNQIASVVGIETTTGNNWMDHQYEYNNQGLLSKSVERVENETVMYHFNDQKQLASFSEIVNNREDIKDIVYDQLGNISRVYDRSNPNYQEEFIYDTKKNPYENMTIDFTYDDFDLTFNKLYTLKIGKNNIVSYRDDNGNEWIVEHTFDNKEVYPTKSVSYLKKDRAKLGTSYAYTYKDITIEK